MRRGIQFGALPFAVGPDGGIRVLLLTSRETKRWVIPKGWPMRHRKPHEAAAQEAFEEAGVTGAVLGKRPVGQYSYSKVIAPSVAVPCVVKVFLLQVSDQAEEWPERHERTVRWFDPRVASEKVAEPELAALLRNLPALVRRRRKQASRKSKALQPDAAEKDVTV